MLNKLDSKSQFKNEKSSQKKHLANRCSIEINIGFTILLIRKNSVNKYKNIVCMKLKKQEWSTYRHTPTPGSSPEFRVLCQVVALKTQNFPLFVPVISGFAFVQ